MTIDLDSTICGPMDWPRWAPTDMAILARGLSPAPRRGRRYRRGADGPAAGGLGQHRPGRPPHFLRETLGRVRYAGATGQPTFRADSGFHTHAIIALCRRPGVRFSITVRLRYIIEAIPEENWRPIFYWMEGAADLAKTEYTPFGSKPGAAPWAKRYCTTNFQVGGEHLGVSRTITKLPRRPQSPSLEGEGDCPFRGLSTWQ